jgi:hypothetical protein
MKLDEQLSFVQSHLLTLSQRIPSGSGILSLRPQREYFNGSFLGA